MPSKLRAFVSSTMDDLQNERRATIKKLLQFGVEPVNAESMSPNGRSSWEVIQAEIEQCHLMVLILGDTYGWVPTEGYGAGRGMSVTHLELDYARSIGVPVVSFLKHLPYGAKRDKKRDKLRSEISNWSDGLFRREFEWADDLEDQVSESLISLFTDSFLKQRVQSRDLAIKVPSPTVLKKGSEPFLLPERSWVMIAGAGLSISAGYPTANALIAALGQELWPDLTSDHNLLLYNFSQVASYFEMKKGRLGLLAKVGQMLDTPQTVRPTMAHEYAVRKFKAIITTNFDELFEDACVSQNIPFQVVIPNFENVELVSGRLVIYKLAGTMSRPETLQLTTSDLNSSIKCDFAFGSVRSMLQANPVVVIGHSLRDGNIQEVMEGRDRDKRGVYVSPYLSPIDEIILDKFNLEGVALRADEFIRDFDPV
ncbi:DUF4062 domain-containing protein [Pseudomonas sp. dw_612]|uniref:DUF4062 domain-containing protein n=1 Tax=Pseudomonas sp. dw_612 TaxID=2720080 RepID=UPI001BD23B55|nr:DUF4062 domain-containing protein [Pseudomonas sp. dw_612]